MQLEDLRVYNMSLRVGEIVWNQVAAWEPLARDTIGKQVIRSADSIAANISEGYGRYHFKENRLFCFYARGSLYETKTWLRKAKNRKLLSSSEFNSLEKELTILAKMLNKYIKSIGVFNNTNDN